MKQKIVKFLKKNNDLINIRELSKKIDISYPTALKYCDILFAEGVIDMKDYGNVKLIQIKK